MPGLYVNVKQNETALKGRGTALNPPIRFEAASQEAFDDGWEHEEQEDKLQTCLIKDTARSIITRNDSPDIYFSQSVNPYRGCEHGCIYCFARPSHAYLGFSPGLDFETKIIFKPGAPALLEKELSRPGYKPDVIVLGSNTDPYQPAERTLGLTRAILEVLERFNHPVAIITKSAAILRDRDILTRMSAKNLARVHLSITTLNAELARTMEPRASSPRLRLTAISALAKAGIPVDVMASPMIPGLNDAELEAILEKAMLSGATSANMTLLRLPYELGDLFTDWLRLHVPERAARVLSLIRQTRAGELNNAAFHQRFQGSGPYAALLAQRFQHSVKRLGLDKAKTAIDLSQFKIPAHSPSSLQMELF